MTTIVVCGDEMASDTMATRGGMIDSAKVSKIVEIEDGILGCAGSMHDIRILQAYFQGHMEGVPEELSCEALLLPKRGKPRLITVSNGCMIEDVVDNKTSIGSGSVYALAALDAGVDAKTAVKIAIGRDCYSGGKVEVFSRKAKKGR